MATAEGPPRAHDRNGRRHAFSSWMKRLANLKNPSSESSTTRWSNKRHGVQKGKKSDSDNKNTPYPLSGRTDSGNRASHEVSNTSNLEPNEHHGAESRSQSAPSLSYSGCDNQPPATSAKSTTPTDGEAGKSDEVYSKAGTLTTAGGGISTAGGGEGSTFSSPAPSVRSLTTTLTTVQSAAPSNQAYMGQNAQQGLTHVNSAQSVSAQQVQFSQQFPTTPASAVPPHLVPHGHQTYSTATANNLLTDNASMLTLASSSKRRRRNSVDTNASIRALPPSSIFSGSRESLPLSVLSGNAAEPSSASAFNHGGVPNRPSLVGLASTERASVYSSSGVAALNNTGERASLHTNRPVPDGASIRSNSYSHARNDSTAANSPLASPVTGQTPTNGRVSRRSSGWGEIVDDESANEKQEVEQKADEKSELKSQKSTDDPEKASEQTTPKHDRFQ